MGALPEKRSRLLTVRNAVASHFYALYHDALSISGIQSITAMYYRFFYAPCFSAAHVTFK